MDELEWLNCNDVYPQQLLIVQEYASVRKLRLIAAALVRRLQSLPEHQEAKRCDDIIEAVADQPRAWEELERELRVRPGDWRFTGVLVLNDLTFVVKELRRLVAFHQCDPTDYPLRLIHEAVGNPFRPVPFSSKWRTDTAVSLARQMYESHEFSAMPILADALQDAGCDSDDVLSHCRGDGPHVRGCWVVDLVLGKE
jgi:hypothetical protein